MPARDSLATGASSASRLSRVGVSTDIGQVLSRSSRNWTAVTMAMTMKMR